MNYFTVPLRSKITYRQQYFDSSKHQVQINQLEKLEAAKAALLASLDY